MDSDLRRLEREHAATPDAAWESYAWALVRVGRAADACAVAREAWFRSTAACGRARVAANAARKALEACAHGNGADAGHCDPCRAAWVEALRLENEANRVMYAVGRAETALLKAREAENDARCAEHRAAILAAPLPDVLPPMAW